jgi:biopolymer transport protein ExbD
MADIAFLLIIFFMVTAVFSATKGLEFKLPKDQNQGPGVAEAATFIRVNPDASILVDCQPMPLTAILDYLEPHLAEDPEKPVILYTDPYASFEAMIAVYDVLAAAEERGFEVRNVSVPTQSEVQEYVALFGLNPFDQCGG